MTESSSTCGDTTGQYENLYTKKSTNIEEIMRQFDASKPKKVSFIRRLLNVFK